LQQNKGVIWLTKCLTTLANGTRFGGKEPAFDSLNEKFAAWRSKIPEFVDKISQAPAAPKEAEEPRKLDVTRLEADLDSFAVFLTKSLPKMEGAEGEVKATAAELQGLLEKLKQGNNKEEKVSTPTPSTTAAAAATPTPPTTAATAATPSPPTTTAAAAATTTTSSIPAKSETVAEKPKPVVKPPPKMPAKAPTKGDKPFSIISLLLGAIVCVVAIAFYLVRGPSAEVKS